MERKLRYLDKEIKRDNIPMQDVGDNPEAPQPREMIDLEVCHLPSFVPSSATRLLNFVSFLITGYF